MIPLLITGVESGLGRYLHECWGGLGLGRRTLNRGLREAGRQGVGVIVHCAGNPAGTVPVPDLPGYLEDNLLLTQRLTELPHRKFVYLSSAAVYAGQGRRCSEGQRLTLAAGMTPYALTKLMAEALVIRAGRRPLILRPTFMLGRYSRLGNLTRLLAGRPYRLSLAAASSYNVVLHEDVGGFILAALARRLTGVFNLAAGGNITLRRVAALCNPAARFGRVLYRVGMVSNRKARAVYPALAHTSAQNITRFLGGA